MLNIQQNQCVVKDLGGKKDFFTAGCDQYNIGNLWWGEEICEG